MAGTNRKSAADGIWADDAGRAEYLARMAALTPAERRALYDRDGRPVRMGQTTVPTREQVEASRKAARLPKLAFLDPGRALPFEQAAARE